MYFIIIAGVLLVINIVFLAGSLVYTMKSKNAPTPRLSMSPSTLSCQMDPRRSIQPQVTLYQTMVRLSGGTLPHEHQIVDKKAQEAAK